VNNNRNVYDAAHARDAGGISAEIYRTVFRRLIGHPPDTIAPMAGRTDRALTTDTLRHHDVRAGHEGGAGVVAVATGATPAADLRLSGAEVVLPDLTDTPAVLHAVLGV
jgi:hypothetical protein